MFKKIIGLGGALVAGIVSACDDIPQSQQVYLMGDETWPFLVSATRKGPLLVDVEGAPFPQANADAPTRVAAAVSQGITALKISTTLSESEAPTPNTRLVVRLGTPYNAPIEHICDGDISTMPTEGEKMHVMMGFCVDGTLRAAAKGSIKNATNPADKPFVKLIGHMARQVLVKKD